MLSTMGGGGLVLVRRALREMDWNAGQDTGQHGDLDPHPLSDLQMEPMVPPSRTLWAGALHSTGHVGAPSPGSPSSTTTPTLLPSHWLSLLLLGDGLRLSGQTILQAAAGTLPGPPGARSVPQGPSLTLFPHW